jgi:hypothetical protein
MTLRSTAIALTVAALASACGDRTPMPTTTEVAAPVAVVGVVLHDTANSYPGINSVAGYYFADMGGNKVKQRPADLCHEVGDRFYVGIPDSGNFSMFDSRDSIIWTVEMVAHHEVMLDEQGNIMVLGYEIADYTKPKMLFPELVTISRKGKVLKRQGFVKLADDVRDAFKGRRDSLIASNRAFVEQYFPHRAIIFDTAVFHVNSVQIIPPNPLEEKHPAFKRGNLLMSCFMNSLIMVVDRKTMRLLWHYEQTDSRLGQHAARMHPDGRISFFLNNIEGENGQLYSAVRIIDPMTGTVEWEFNGSPERSLHSFTQGHCQFLPNGNVLVTVNNEVVKGEGYVMEVTAAGTPVWKWIPEEYEKMSEKREGFYRVERITALP